MKKVLFIFLAAVLLLCSCQSTLPPHDDPSPEQEPSDLILCENGQSLYTIVFPYGDFPYERTAALKLATRLQARLGVSFQYVDDRQAPSEHEILIGQTNREIELPALEADQIDLRIDGTHVILRWSANDLYEQAIDLFIESLLTEGEKITLPLSNQQQKTIQRPEVITMNVRVASFNIHAGADVGYDFSILSEDILKSGADVIGLQEVDRNTGRNKNQDTLAVLSQYTGYPYYCYAKTEDFSGGEYGIGILSRYPIVESEYIYLPRGSSNPEEENRAIQYACIEIEGGLFHFINTHFGFGVSDVQQLTAIRTYIQEKKLPHYVIVGDFNYEIHLTAKNVFSKVTLALTEKNYTATYKGGSVIDNVVMSEGIQLTGLHVYDMCTINHSDHNIVAATLTLQAEKKS